MSHSGATTQERASGPVSYFRPPPAASADTFAKWSDGPPAGRADEVAASGDTPFVIGVGASGEHPEILTAEQLDWSVGVRFRVEWSR